MVVPFLAIVTAFIVGSIFILITDFDNLSKLGTDPAARSAGRSRTSSTPTAPWRRRDRRSRQDPGGDREPGPRADRRGHPPDHRDAGRRDAPDLHRPRGGDLVPQRRVQHRRRGPVHPRRLRRDASPRSRSRASPTPLILIVAIARGRPDRRRLGVRSPGFLKAKTGAHEVITTIMLNYVAVQIVAVRPALGLPAQGGQLASRSRRCCDFVRIPGLFDSSACPRSASTGASSSPW